MEKFKVGIIGNGFVGEAQAFAFSTVSNTYIYDIDPLKSTHKLDDIHACDFVFVCVPTPMKEDGSQDISYVENVFRDCKEKIFFVFVDLEIKGFKDRY